MQLGKFSVAIVIFYEDIPARCVHLIYYYLCSYRHPLHRVCYLAGEVVQALKQTQTQDVIDTVDIMCVKIAGLCYNLGLKANSIIIRLYLVL